MPLSSFKFMLGKTVIEDNQQRFSNSCEAEKKSSCQLKPTDSVTSQAQVVLQVCIYYVMDGTFAASFEVNVNYICFYNVLLSWMYIYL